MFFVFKLITALWLLARVGVASPGEEMGFTYNGFQSADVQVEGRAKIEPNGLLILTNSTTKRQKGNAFYRSPIHFHNPTSPGALLSFSTTFVFAIVSQNSSLSGHGIAFVIAPTLGLPYAFPNRYLGLFNESNVGSSSNHVFAVELDTVKSSRFHDINGNHVGVNINGLVSIASKPASYFDKNGQPQNLTLSNGHSMQVWIDYDGVHRKLNVTLAPIFVSKPALPLLSLSLDLSRVLIEPMFVGFSSSTSEIRTASHYILGWSFKLNAQAEQLNLTLLPSLPLQESKQKHNQQHLIIGLPIITAVLALAMVFGVQIVLKRKRKYEELLEEWELEYGPTRFKYKDLYMATGGFKPKELLGVGGFGQVYRGVLPTSKIEVAVKKISHESTQGMKEFVAEIVTIGKLRHRNLVTLLGYCRRKGELILVYEYVPNGSLNKFLFNPSMPLLSWSQRFQIIRGVASALFYLHEEWEQVVIHRDVKSSNVLLDSEFNARLGDFGLARSYGHGTEPQTTHVAGTLGYLAPELSRTGKPNTSTDVYAFGAFMLEVGCGRRPINQERVEDEYLVLVDWVFHCWRRGAILDVVDPKLRMNYVETEMEMVLELGLLCSSWDPTARPTMRQILQYLEGELPFSLPDLSCLTLGSNGLTSIDAKSTDDFALSLSPSLQESSILSGGR